MLLFCNVSQPLKLWETSWEALSDDILHKKRIQLRYPDMILTEAQIQNYCLAEIQMLLNKNGKALSDFPDLPQPDPSLIIHLDNRLIREELNYNIQELKTVHDSLYNSLNPDQLKVYQSVIGAVNAQAGGLFFVYGPGGTGKTFLYNTILTKLRSERMIVLTVASSAPMTQRYAFEALNKTLRDILGAKAEENRRKLFGGMPILLGGDFRQILPVIPKGKRQEVVQACINRSDLWKFCQIHTLSRIMRVNEYTSDGTIDTRKQLFNKWVLDIGDGNLPAHAKEGEDEPTWIEIP
ncbi:uncharacterized protein [Rutidosis leptorrhynchoides]|uniref:uncharacterized protein n=1 Tax=Rutidosis leptorrhynchoides TaxID=125765 RepID=UPI003A98D9F9